MTRRRNTACTIAAPAQQRSHHLEFKVVSGPKFVKVRSVSYRFEWDDSHNSRLSDEWLVLEASESAGGRRIQESE